MTEETYRKLSKSEIERQMTGLKRWRLIKGKLHRELGFKSFEDAISFMVRASLEISRLNHHPEWFNVYNQVRIDLVTHDVGGISNYDLILAKKLDGLASRFRAK